MKGFSNTGTNMPGTYSQPQPVQSLKKVSFAHGLVASSIDDAAEHPFGEAATVTSFPTTTAYDDYQTMTGTDAFFASPPPHSQTTHDDSLLQHADGHSADTLLKCRHYLY